jgi:hypothetical protein
MKLTSLCTMGTTVGIFALTACGELPGFQVGAKTDVFVSSASPIEFTDLDILFVVDNSGSMSEEQANLAASFDSFITQFATRNLDFHIGVISTDVTPGTSYWNGSGGWGCEPYAGIFNGGPGTLLSKHSGIPFITPDTPDFINVFKDNVQLGTCGSGAETGIRSAYQFMDSSNIGSGGYNEGFIRDDGFLAVIFLSDEDESRNYTTSNYLKDYASERSTLVSNFSDRILALKDGDADSVRVDAIVAPSVAECPTVYGGTDGVGDVYMEVATALNGETSNICEDFSSSLVNIGTELLTILTRFALLQPPVDADVEVRVNGALIPESETNGWVLVVIDGQYYVEFRGAATPSNGDEIGVTYVPSAPAT